MYNNPIEDILIDHTPKKEKKKGKGIIWVIIFLFVVAIICAVGYFFYQKTNIEGNKASFFEGFSNSKFGFYTTNNVVEQISSNFENVNSEVITNVKLTNSLELPEAFQGIDLAKLVFDIRTRKSVSLSTQNTDVSVSYSDNEIAKFRLINEDDKVAITSPDLITGYVGYNKEAQEDIRDDIKLPDVVTFSDKDAIAGKISVETANREVRNNKLREYSNYIIENLDLKKFSANSNYILQKQSGNTINVKAYKLTMSKVELESMLKSIISKINQDEELKTALVVKNEEENLRTPAIYNQVLAPEDGDEELPSTVFYDVPEETVPTEENVEENPVVEEQIPAEETNFNVELRLEPRGNLGDLVGSEQIQILC